MKNKYNFSEEAIAEAAYYIWQKNGCPMNSSLQDWNAAIEQLTYLANTKKTTISSKKSLLSSLSSKKTSACKTSTATKKSSVKKVATKKSK